MQLKFNNMMNEMNNAWGIGSGMGYGWIICAFVLVVVIWIIVKSVNHKTY